MDTATRIAPATAEPVVVSRPPVAKNPSLLSPTLDVLVIGGASIVMFGLAWLMVDKGSSTNQISWAAFYLAFLINNPHFMSSYMLLYWDKRKELLRKPKFLWAGVIAPTLLVAWLGGAIAMGSPKFLGYAVNLMFFTVGWHYIKQIYGTIVVTNARRGYYLDKRESLALRLNLFPVWFMSFINGNSSTRTIMEYGMGYQTFNLPTWVRDLNYVLVAVSLVTVGVVVARKWLRDGKLPGWPAIASFAAIYVWYLPTLYHAHFWYMIPFFHSLQYMLFVWGLKKNQYAAEAAAAAPSDPAGQRLYFSKHFWGFIACATVTALFAFKLVPEFLDNRVAYDEKLFGTELFMFCFITFINIHHYFIDNVLWRRDNEVLKKYLF